MATGGYLDPSRGLEGVRQCGGGGRHGEEEDGELGHGSESDRGMERLGVVN